MLWTICLILLVLWALECSPPTPPPDDSHPLVVALVVVLIRVIQGRRIMG
jgi:hypothetical protein